MHKPDLVSLVRRMKKAFMRAKPSRNLHGRFDDLVFAVEDYAIFTMNPDGIILDWNRGAERIKQYTAEEIVGTHFSRLYSDEDRAGGLPERELEIAAREKHHTAEGWRLRKDGSRFWASVTITALLAADARPLGYLKITRDLTERTLSHEVLWQSEERFRLLVESVQDYAIFMIDPGGHVMSWNEGARRIKGYEQEEILGEHFSIFYPPEAVMAKAPEALLRKAIEEGRAEDEGWRVRKDGSRFWGDIVITPLYDSNAVLRGFTKITRDLTKQREVESIQKNERIKNVFLATLAHELRNPMAPILYGVDVLLRSPADPSKAAEIAGMLQRQVGQMGRLIDDLLDFSRISTGKIVLHKTRARLPEMLKCAVEAVAPMIELFQHELLVRQPEGMVEIEADANRISQAVTNLLSNAAKYTPPGGRIVLEATVEHNTDLRIVVSDNGQGIAPELQDQIFELFEQGANSGSGGLGIGLSIVKTMAMLHNGSATVESAGAGAGSKFTMVLPVVVAPESPAPGARPKSRKFARRNGPSRVLVAEDGKIAADILAMFFRMEGLETAVAYDGQQALETAQHFHPHLVCMDLGMPRMDGFEAARRIRMLDKDVVIVALSGWGADEDRKRTTEAGFDCHMVKPANPDDIRSMIARYLPGRR